MDAPRLGDGGVEQVGTYRAGRRDTKVKQDGSHERAATDTGEADNKTNRQPGDDVA